MTSVYAATGDVAKYLGRGDKLLSSSSPLSVGDLEKIIVDVAMEIDSVLMHLDVDLPVASGDAPHLWGFLNQLNAIGAAALAELRLFGEAAPGARGTNRHEILLKEYHRMLDGLGAGIYDLSEIGSSLPDYELVFSGSEKDADGREVEPFFKRKDVY
jgi:hypothetical protein